MNAKRKYDFYTNPRISIQDFIRTPVTIIRMARCQIWAMKKDKKDLVENGRKWRKKTMLYWIDDCIILAVNQWRVVGFHMAVMGWG